MRTTLSHEFRNLLNSVKEFATMSMSFNEVIAELPRLTFEERQILIRRAVELDDLPLSAADEELVGERLAAHHDDPSSSVTLVEVKKRLRSRTK